MELKYSVSQNYWFLTSVQKFRYLRFFNLQRFLGGKHNCIHWVKVQMGKSNFIKHQSKNSYSNGKKTHFHPSPSSETSFFSLCYRNCTGLIRCKWKSNWFSRAWEIFPPTINFIYHSIIRKHFSQTRHPYRVKLNIKIYEWHKINSSLVFQSWGPGKTCSKISWHRVQTKMYQCAPEIFRIH